MRSRARFPIKVKLFGGLKATTSESDQRQVAKDSYANQGKFDSSSESSERTSK